MTEVESHNEQDIAVLTLHLKSKHPQIIDKYDQKIINAVNFHLQ